MPIATRLGTSRRLDVSPLRATCRPEVPPIAGFVSSVPYVCYNQGGILLAFV